MLIIYIFFTFKHVCLCTVSIFHQQSALVSFLIHSLCLCFDDIPREPMENNKQKLWLVEERSQPQRMEVRWKWKRLYCRRKHLQWTNSKSISKQWKLSDQSQWAVIGHWVRAWPPIVSVFDWGQMSSRHAVSMASTCRTEAPHWEGGASVWPGQRSQIR